MHEALFYEPAGDLLQCWLCPFHCRIAEGDVGHCRVRRNDAGMLVSLNYGEVTSAHVDPIEKKPLYHFHPGAMILSLGTFGCNLTCGFCQNWQISQQRPQTQTISPEAAAELAADMRVSRGNIGIAYTYNEPMIWFEHVLDTARLVRERGMVNVLVTNGIVEEGPLEELLPVVDAMNVDIKAMDDAFYARNCGGKLASAARRTVERAFGRCHVEITNLIIPGENDSDEALVSLFDWAASVSPALPVHLSRYHPDYQMTNARTPEATLKRAYDLASQRLQFVYVGNAEIRGTSDTVCPGCGATAVERVGFTARSRTKDGTCPACGVDLGVVI